MPSIRLRTLASLNLTEHLDHKREVTLDGICTTSYVFDRISVPTTKRTKRTCSKIGSFNKELPTIIVNMTRRSSSKIPVKDCSYKIPIEDQNISRPEQEGVYQHTRSHFRIIPPVDYTVVAQGLGRPTRTLPLQILNQLHLSIKTKQAPT